MPRHETIVSLPEAKTVSKEMNLRGYDVGDDCRAEARQAMAEALEWHMRDRIDEHHDAMERRGEADRRNGGYIRHLLTELGDLTLHVPRTRTFCPNSVVRAYARRTREVDRVILAAFVPGGLYAESRDGLTPHSRRAHQRDNGEPHFKIARYLAAG